MNFKTTVHYLSLLGKTLDPMIFQTLKSCVSCRLLSVTVKTKLKPRGGLTGMTNYHFNGLHCKIPKPCWQLYGQMLNFKIVFSILNELECLVPSELVQ